MASMKGEEMQKAASGTAPSAPAAAASGSLFSWRNPAPEKQKKYGIVPLGEDFEPTPQEQRLLDMYETIKAYEKKAAYIKKDAALRKLQEAQEIFKNEQQKKKKSKRNREPKKKVAADEEKNSSDEDSDEDDDDDSGEDADMQDENIAKQERRAQALEEMRQEVAEAKEKTGARLKEEEDTKIAKMLAQKDDDEEVDDQPILIKKAKKNLPADGPSLLANLQPQATPPHDFSSKLGLEPGRGKVLFPLDEDEDLMGLHNNTERKENIWTPPEGVRGPNDGCFLSYLNDFDMEAAPGTDTCNTLAIKFAVPEDSKRFSLNIAQADQPQRDFDSILFHFNPRQQRGGQLVMNDKSEGVWGQALSIPLSQIPLIFGQPSVTLQIQIHAEGFDVFVEKQHCARLEHRQDLLTSENSKLCLQFPSTDDYGKPENWQVFKIWWGYKPIMASSDAGKLAGVAGVNSFNSIHPRKLFIRGLPKIHTPSDVDLRRAELERAFARYGGSRGIVKVVVYNKKTYASVEMETDRLADLALQEMSGKYQLNRARRTKIEALQEERSGKEGGGVARKGGGNDWD